MTDKRTEVKTEVHLWNRTYPVGMPVEVTRDNGEKFLTCTRERAVLRGDQAVVWVDRIRGYYLLSRVRPIEEKIEFHEAVHLDPTMPPEMKVYWLNESCKHLNSLLEEKTMKPNYCIGRVIELKEGYGKAADGKPPLTVKYSMEPNPYTPSFLAEISISQELAGDLKVSDRVRFDMRKATEEEWEAFKAAVKEPRATAAT